MRSMLRACLSLATAVLSGVAIHVTAAPAQSAGRHALAEAEAGPISAEGVTRFAQAGETAPGAAHRLKKLQVAYVKNLSFAPLYLAVEKGYLAQEGIEAELKIVRSASEVVAFLGRGQIDVAFGNIGIPLFNAVGRNVDVKVVGGVTYTPSDKTAPSPNPILIRKALAQSGAVKIPADLKGRKLAMNTRGGVIEYEYAQALKSVGLSLADVQTPLMSFQDSLAALANGSVDATIVPEPLSTAAQQRGLASVLVPNPAPALLITVVMVGSSMLQEKDGRTLTAFLRGVRRAINELQSREAVMSPANLAIWARYTDIPAATILKTVPYDYARDLALDVDDLMRQQQYLVDTRQITALQSADKLIASRFSISRK